MITLARRLGAIAALIVVSFAIAPAASAQSYYSDRLEDARAVYLNRGARGAVGDGVADDTAALQRAIDAVQETGGPGVLFVPEGRYRVTHAINVWPGVRVIGYGARRSVLVLADNTPGYGDPEAEARMVFFAGERPSNPHEAPPDSNPGTFYSALSNIDIEIGAGNAGAVGVRGTYAQHAFLAHIDFRLASGLAGVHDTGNVMEDVRFFGGRYGLWTRLASPGWQTTLVDVAFDGQSEAAIRENGAALTLIRPSFRNAPIAIEIDAGAPENLWVRDARLENISGPAFVISDAARARTQINMENVAAINTPFFALLRDNGRNFAAPAPSYTVSVFSHGLNYADINALGETQSRFDAAPLAAPPAPTPSDLVALPPMREWVNVRGLGAKGDGVSDDTAVIRAAIAAHKAIYFPQGYYVVSDTIVLRPDTVLIGMHPRTTQIGLRDGTPAFQGIDGPKALIEAPAGGTNVIIGLGVNTGGANRRAAGIIWRAGPHSMINDVKFHGGHGSSNLDGTFQHPYNSDHTGDSDPHRVWDSQYPSLWITDGGGGTFFDIWTASTFAQSGLLASDTQTEGRVYELSSEHHVRNEIQLHNVANWRLYAVQTEAERGESGFDLPIEISGSRNITIANTHIYRVISSNQPFPTAVDVRGSSGIRVRNMHSFTNSKAPYDATIRDTDHNAELPQEEFAWLDVGAAPAPPPRPVRPMAAQGARVEMLAGHFDNISGGAVDPSGDYYFVDRRWSRIYRWSPHGLLIALDAPIAPVNLAADASGDLMIVSYDGEGAVFAFNPHEGVRSLRRLTPVPAAPRPGATPILPINTYDWGAAPPVRIAHFVSPDGTVFIAADRDFLTGATSWGVKSADLIRGFGLAPAKPGAPFYVTLEARAETYVMDVRPDGAVANARPFIHRGGQSVAVDADGDVYLASGDIYVYDSTGRWLDTIRVPGRVTDLTFGGPDKRTLFIAAGSALYALRVRTAGR